MIVMKFGGTSVGSAARMSEVADIVTKLAKKKKVVVVVSAVSGATNLLVECTKLASERKKPQLNKQLEKLYTLHRSTLEDLALPAKVHEENRDILDKHFKHLKNLLYSIHELAEASKRSQDLVTSFGERMSIHLVAAAIQKKGKLAQPVEANELIVTSDDFGSAKPLLSESAEKTKLYITKLVKKKIIPVITGFLGANKQGVITTLGRGGSDYSATILGNCLDASEVWIWTDVDGVMTADPRIVKEAKSIEVLSYNEATELSYFGAKVLHPLTMVPAALKEIPIVIKNTFRPEFEGTRIEKKPNDTRPGIKAISTFEGISLITLQGKGMIGVPGVSAKLFTVLAASDINVHFISQASSEFNISFVVAHVDGERTVQVLKDAFALELMNKYIETVKKEDGLAIVAAVGQGMRGKPGTAGKLFSALGSNGINIRAIAQGSSERNITCLIADTDVKSAVQVIHSAYKLAQ